MKRYLSPALFLFLLPFQLPAKSNSDFAPVREAIQRSIDDHQIAGAVTVVATADKILDLSNHGYADLEAKRPMQPNHLFWIASMTKPIAAAAVLMLQEQGKLNVSDLVEKHLPEFKDQWLARSKTTNQMVLVRPARSITIHDLLTHTSGIGDVRLPRTHCTLAELVALYSQQPLQFEPGAKWQYSTAGINVLGRIVEVTAGIPCEDFYDQKIFKPLGMKDTTFWPNEKQTSRLALSYKRTPNGTLEKTEVSFVQGALSDRQRPPLPGGGLFSTANDVTRFYQMMLNGGTLAGKQIMRPETVRLLTTTQSGDLRTGFTDGMSWGFGFQVVKEPQGVTAMLSPGTFGHGGAYGTQSWADPKTGRIYILMIQRAGFPNGDNSPVRKAFQEAVAEVLK